MTHPPTPSKQRSPEQVCADLSRMWFAPDTRRDTSFAEARIRAAKRYGTPQLQQRASAGGSVKPSTQWQELARHGAAITTRITPYRGETPPPTESGTAYAAVTVTRVATGGGWREQLPAVTAYCTLTQHQGQWQVDALDAALHPGGR